MDDVIRRQDAIDALKEHRTLFCDNTPNSFSKLTYGKKCRVNELDNAIATIANLPSAQQWIPCTERMPAIKYDHYGNWYSEEVILLMNDDGFVNVCTGYFARSGVFETYEKDEGPLYIGLPVRDVKAWMPLPAPLEGDD